MGFLSAGNMGGNKMKDVLVRVGAAVVAAGLAVGGLLFAPTTGLAGGGDRDVPQALTDWGGCLSRHSQGDLLLLMDASGSLAGYGNIPGTDPDDQRVIAADYLMRRLAEFSSSNHYDINVAIATFSVNFSMVQDWQPLTVDTVGQFRSAVQLLADQDHGMETDYWTALEGARQSLAPRAAQGRTCQAIAWFSDGQLDIVDGASSGVVSKPFAPNNPLKTSQDLDSAKAAAANELCRPQGLADGLRAAHVAVFAFGLGSSVDFSLMSGIATGEKCGALIDPSPGAFWKADDIDRMIFDLTNIAGPDHPPTTQEEPICQGSPCVEGYHSVVLDDSVNSVEILGFSPVDWLDVYIIDPSGTKLRLTGGSGVQTSTSDVRTVTWEWLTGRTVSVGLERQGAGWQGQWVIVFVDPSGGSSGMMSETSIRVTGGLRPTWTSNWSGPIHVGDVLAGTRVGLEDRKGQTVEPTNLLGEARVLVELVAGSRQAVPVTSLDKADMLKPLDIDLHKVSVGHMSLRLTLYVTTAPVRDVTGAVVVAGTEFAPTVTEYPIDIEPPLDYPQVASVVDFGIMNSKETMSSSQSLAIKGAGCVWLDLASMKVLAAPTSVKSPTLSGAATSADHCVTTGPAGGSLPLKLSVDALDNGAFTGTVDVHLGPANEPDRAIVQTITFTADMRKPVDRGLQIGTMVICMVAGPVLPLLLLWALKAVAGRIPGDLVARTLNVEVTDNGVTHHGSPVVVVPDEELEAVVVGHGRTVQAGELSLRTRVGLNPFGTARVVAETPGRVGASKHKLMPTGKEHYAELPLAVQNNWVLVVDPSAGNGQATLTVLASGAANAEILADIVSDANTRAWVAYQNLRKAVPSPDPSSDSGGAQQRGSGIWDAAGGDVAADPAAGSVWQSGSASGDTPSSGTAKGSIWDQ